MSFELILPFLRPIESLLLDENVSEIMGNPDASWWYERDGIMFQEQNISFDAGKLQTGLEVVANQLGKKLDEDNPLLHAQLPDGSRLAAVIPPVVRPAPALTIRKFTSRHYTIDEQIHPAKVHCIVARHGGEIGVELVVAFREQIAVCVGE